MNTAGPVRPSDYGDWQALNLGEDVKEGPTAGPRVLVAGRRGPRRAQEGEESWVEAPRRRRVLAVVGPARDHPRRRPFAGRKLQSRIQGGEPGRRSLLLQDAGWRICADKADDAAQIKRLIGTG